MPRRPTFLLATFLIACPPRSSLALEPGVGAELWVDAFAKEGGDGTAEQPLRRLDLALSRLPPTGGRVLLAAGIYSGPFRVPANVRLQGTANSILFAEGDQTVVSPQGPLLLKDLSIQGGGTGLEVSGQVQLEGVRLSGQRRVAIHLASGSLKLSRCELSASISEVLGVAAEPSTQMVIEDSHFVGPFRRGIELRSDGTLQVREVQWEGANTGIHQVGGKSVIRGARFAGGRGPAVFVAKGELHSEGVTVFGHEYGLLANEGAVLQLRDFLSVRAERAGIALVKARAEMELVVTVDSGSFGGIQLVSSVARLRQFWLHRPQAYGISARQSRIDVSNGVITEVQGPGDTEGDGIHLRSSKGSIQSVSVRGAQGAGVLAAEESKLELRDLLLERCRWGGLITDTSAQVRASSLTVRSSESAAIVALGASQADVQVLTAEQNAQGAIWAECQSGARVRLWRSRSTERFEIRSPCVEYW